MSGGEGDGNPRQYSCLENSMDRGAWQARVHGGTKSRTRLNDFHSLKASEPVLGTAYIPGEDRQISRGF